MEEKKISVLAIDDDAVQLKLYKNVLHPKFDLFTVNSASNAIYFLNSNEVNVILLDISMPNITGFDFLNDIRKVPSYYKVPIIVVSSKTGDDFINEAKKSTAFDVLSKPVEPDALIAAIEKAASSDQEIP